MTSSGFRPCSPTRRRTTGDNNRLSPLAPASAGAASAGAGVGSGAVAAATGSGAGAGAGSAAAGSGAGAGAGSAAAGSGAGAGSGSGAGAGSDAGAGSAGAGSAGAASADPTTAMTAPTGTVSPSWARICCTMPAIGEGTSVSTLSVLTSNSGSSAATCSPTFLNQRVIVPSVTVSPNCGRVTSAIASSPVVGSCSGAQPFRLRPVRDNTVSPNSSLRLGCGWMNSATSPAVASQFTAR